jgi:hypothetical protein
MPSLVGPPFRVGCGPLPGAECPAIIVAASSLEMVIVNVSLVVVGCVSTIFDVRAVRAARKR